MRYVAKLARWISIALIGALAIGPGQAFGRSGRPVRRVPSPLLGDAPEDCQQNVPATASVSGVTDDGHEIALDVLVLLDGVPKSQGKAIFTDAAKSYVPLAIKLTAHFRKASFAADGKHTDQWGRDIDTADEQHLFAQAIDLLGGGRPAGIDVVYILTNKDLYTTRGADSSSSAGGMDYSIGGVADCIGGIMYNDKAFAAGENYWQTSAVIGAGPKPLPFGDGMLSKIAAHEIGHVLGAQHHYGNCVQGAPADMAGDGEFDPCTLMFPSFPAANFGSLDGSVVRGYALSYADN
jgi:hypothetical protein